jgi:hypothetical protein
MRRWRIVLGVAGIALGLFGIGRLVTQIPVASLVGLGLWLIAALVIHDGILSPLVLVIGAFVARVPPRSRRYLQAGLIMSAMVTVLAIPMIYRAGSEPISKAILDQNFSSNLAVLLGVIGGATLLAYAIRVARDHGDTASPSPADQEVEDRKP